MSGIVSGFFKGIKSIGEETVEKTVEHTGKIASGIITGQDLVGLNPLTQAQEKKVVKDEEEKQKEIEYIKRDIEGEIEKVHQEKEQRDEQQEKFLENLKRQREAEARADAQLITPGNSKREAAKRGMQRGHKAMAPDPASLSATGEMTGGKID